jgi:hypothetical protein
MLQKSTIRRYVTLLLFQTMLGAGFILPAFGSATRCGGYPVFYIVRAEDGVHIYSDPEDQDAINAWFDDPALIGVGSVTLYPYRKVGPIDGIFELYSRESLLSSPDDYRWQLFDLELTQSELNYAHQELIRFAKNDSWLAQFQPGAPARIEFLPAQTLLSIIKVGTYFGFPALITWLMRYFKTHTHDAIVKSRRDAGLCIHCAYDCRDLPSLTCPECGQPHTIPTESPVARLAEPGS